MPTTSNHHVAVRVADLEQSAKFYEAAFGATRAIDSFVVDGDFGAMIAAGPKGTSMRILPIEFPDGGAIELFNFEEPQRPTAPIDAWEGTLMHFAIQVDDTDATLEKIEAAGGKRIWPEVLEMGKLRLVYVHDLDGNVVEVLDGSMDEVIELIRAAYF
jgi:catechol 2,3-dioxygenase-like lactoylglutathione lyase family enzyme